MTDGHIYTQVDHELLQATSDPWLAIVWGYVQFKANGSGTFYGSVARMADTLGTRRNTIRSKLQTLTDMGYLDNTGRKKHLTGQGAWAYIYTVQGAQQLPTQDGQQLPTKGSVAATHDKKSTKRVSNKKKGQPIADKYNGVVTDAYNALRGSRYTGTVKPAPAALQQQFIEQLACELPDDPDAACAYVQNQLSYQLRELRLEPLVDMTGVLTELVETYEDG